MVNHMKKHRVLVLGSEGYIGYSLCLSLFNEDCAVIGMDNFYRENNVHSLKSRSATPIENRKRPWKFIEADVTDYKKLLAAIKYYTPDTIVHLAEQPSAPFSMIDAEHAANTQFNNIIGTLNVLWAIKTVNPDIHLVKLGTMGEWSDWLYENSQIPESHRIKVKYQDKDMEIPVPRYAGSFYHWSKIHDTNNIDFANRIWGIKCTDIMQGVVYGTRIKEMDEKQFTRFDYDECFGTVINRFVTQAIVGIPLTVYGKGGQTRGYLPLKDSIQCLKLIIKNPPKDKEYRLINQLAELYSVNGLAKLVQETAKEFGIDAKIKSVPNPRLEKEVHKYSVKYDKLKELGYTPSSTIKAELQEMFDSLIPNRKRIVRKVIKPVTLWK